MNFIYEWQSYYVHVRALAVERYRTNCYISSMSHLLEK